MKILGDDGTIRGAWIQTFITLIYLSFICVGLFYSPVADAIVKLQDFMTWFFGISFVVWSTKKTVEYVVDGKTIKADTGQQQ